LEFAAKIRTQSRQRQPELELEAELKEALQREHLAEIAVEALRGVTTAKRRFWLIPVICILSWAAVLAAFVTVISSRHSRKDTLQLKRKLRGLTVDSFRREKSCAAWNRRVTP
jgi:hypothetical protein